MKDIEVSDEAYEKISFAANIAGISLAVAVDRLIAKASEPPKHAKDTEKTSEVDADEITVVASYRGHEVSGFLNLATERLRITAAPKAELIRSYRSPSNAAVEIVRALNPARQRPETNGWRFFNGPDGQVIDRHRRHRP
ncbi:hypothetical protein HH310_06890 [Actinoplanes sp. TBRC 11911]|uniref:hypothetical protein n=1 Tax=Actinoplanes sp. TBRC 11911 TaxID=2729386 RepID=UPI00145EEE0B|nr:hypothetical protein [Actinoplanes sp. TBRC 11911]NMO50917.1 hypothetical protein [Actinoplanes sp. TBRC 11911]